MEFPVVASKYDYVNVFFNNLAPIVVNEYIRRHGEYRLYPSTVLAMAALESGFNLNATTLFGIKGEGVVLDTTEYINGEYVNVKDSFKYFPNLTASVQGLYDLVQWDNYDRATSSTDWEEECRMMHACGYATDPDYADKLINIVNSYQLTMFNTVDNVVADDKEEIPKYTVQSGDTLWSIVSDYYGYNNDTDIASKINELVEYNHIADANMIYPNQEILMI